LIGTLPAVRFLLGCGCPLPNVIVKQRRKRKKCVNSVPWFCPRKCKAKLCYIQWCIYNIKYT
jgi:hypothetical protein